MLMEKSFYVAIKAIEQSFRVVLEASRVLELMNLIIYYTLCDRGLFPP